MSGEELRAALAELREPSGPKRPEDIFDRLMALWQEPWSELAFGEAQMLAARLRDVLAAPSTPEPNDPDMHPDAVYGREWVPSVREAIEAGQAWSEQVINDWSPDERSRAIEAEARELAGGNHVHGAIPARFWRQAIALRAAPSTDPSGDDHDHHFDKRCETCRYLAGAAPSTEPALDGAGRIAAERRRQIEAEGYTAEHDFDHADELALAAACYALPEDRRSLKASIGGTVSAVVNVQLWRSLWPWREPYWKPTPEDRVRELEKAGALIAAAIDARLAESQP